MGAYPGRELDGCTEQVLLLGHGFTSIETDTDADGELFGRSLCWAKAFWMATARERALAPAAGGQWDSAEEHYQTTLRQAHELPIVLEQPEVRRRYAPGNRDKARELLAEAIAMYRRIGMPKHVDMAEALLGEA